MLANKGHTDWITVSILLSRSAADLVFDCGGISLTQYRILIRLVMSEGTATVSAIASDVGIGISTVTNSLNKLEKLRAVRRDYDSIDKRVVHARITDEGRKLVASIDPAIRQLAHDFWACYTDEELRVTFKDSRMTAQRYHLAYVKNDALSMERAYIDSSWVVTNALTRQMHRFNISLNEYRLLYLLHENDGGIQPSAAARRLLLRSNEIAVAASKLEQHNRITRERNETDRRASTMQITPDGTEKLRRITPAVVNALQYGICDLEEGSLDHYDSIASKLLKANQRLHLLV